MPPSPSPSSSSSAIPSPSPPPPSSHIPVCASSPSPVTLCPSTAGLVLAATQVLRGQLAAGVTHLERGVEHGFPKRRTRSRATRGRGRPRAEPTCTAGRGSRPPAWRSSWTQQAQGLHAARRQEPRPQLRIQLERLGVAAVAAAPVVLHEVFRELGDPQPDGKYGPPRPRDRHPRKHLRPLFRALAPSTLFCCCFFFFLLLLPWTWPRLAGSRRQNSLALGSQSLLLRHERRTPHVHICLQAHLEDRVPQPAAHLGLRARHARPGGCTVSRSS